MPTSAPGISSRRGFTLIELLVVLLIMGLCAGLVGALVRPDDRALLRVEAERLAQLLDLAADGIAPHRQAASPGPPMRRGYRFWRWREDAGWSEAQRGFPARAQPAAGHGRSRTCASKPRSRRAACAWSSVRTARWLTISQMSLGAARYAVAASPLGEVRIHESP